MASSAVVLALFGALFGAAQDPCAGLEDRSPAQLPWRGTTRGAPNHFAASDGLGGSSGDAVVAFHPTESGFHRFAIHASFPAVAAVVDHCPDAAVAGFRRRTQVYQPPRSERGLTEIELRVELTAGQPVWLWIDGAAVDASAEGDFDVALVDVCPGTCGAAACGGVPDGCGSVVDCGHCDGQCQDGVCCTPTCAPSECGEPNGCGGTCFCGPLERCGVLGCEPLGAPSCEAAGEITCGQAGHPTLGPGSPGLWTKHQLCGVWVGANRVAASYRFVPTESGLATLTPKFPMALGVLSGEAGCEVETERCLGAVAGGGGPLRVELVAGEVYTVVAIRPDWLVDDPSGGPQLDVACGLPCSPDCSSPLACPCPSGTSCQGGTCKPAECHPDRCDVPGGIEGVCACAAGRICEQQVCVDPATCVPSATLTCGASVTLQPTTSPARRGFAKWSCQPYPDEDFFGGGEVAIEASFPSDGRVRVSLSESTSDTQAVQVFALPEAGSGCVDPGPAPSGERASCVSRGLRWVEVDVKAGDTFYFVADGLADGWSAPLTVQLHCMEP